MRTEAHPEVPYGAWPSPITASRLVEGAAGVSEVRSDGDDIWWNEQRPNEGGRYQLVRRTAGGTRHDLFDPWDPTPGATSNWNARTAVLEYGGGAWAVRNGVVVFADWADQRLYRVDRGGIPTPITPEPSVARGYRWSEVQWLDDHWLVVVREDHDPSTVEAFGQAVNQVVAIPVDGRAVDHPDLVRVLATGPDFVHTPAVQGDRLAWIQWDHPLMPWDGSELQVATITRDASGFPNGVTDAVLVAGGRSESVVQPGFTVAGDLIFCTDRTGWWNPWRLSAGLLTAGDADRTDAIEPVLADGGADVEIGGPLWVGGQRWWAEMSDGRLAVAFTSGGSQRLGVIDADGHLLELSTPFTEIPQVQATADRADVLVVASTPLAEATPYLLTPTKNADPGRLPSVAARRLRPARDLGVDESWFSVPKPITFPSADGRQAHALFYAPVNPEVTTPPGALPPLLVMIHGGPTSAARHRLDLAKQFWTSRGIAVVDVDYGGSVGYGRPYRELLQGNWGVVDVEDAVAAARHLADIGLVDGDRLAIRGGSAGGFTTLAALCFHDVFKAGASHYGVADLGALAADTHKFESRYLDGLVGPWPDVTGVYADRSPINHTDGFDRPLIVFQGSEDEVVPPNQADMIVDALADKGVPHAYLLFEGEQHGFRQAANIVRALEAELWFYGRVFDFEPADAIEPVSGAVGLG